MKKSAIPFFSLLVFSSALALLAISCTPAPETETPVPAEQAAPAEIPAPVMDEQVSPNDESNPPAEESNEQPTAPESQPEPTPQPPSESEPEPQPEPEPEPQPSVKEISMTARQWEFVPAVVTVNQGDTVRLHVTSEDVTHGIAILSYGVKANLEPGQTETLEFVADKTGTFQMVCSVFCGAGHGGMKASLIVQ